MFEATSQTYTLKDASGGYSWLVENLQVIDYLKFTDEGLSDWVNAHVETTVELDVASAEEAADEMQFPRFGYSTAQVFETKEQYLEFKRNEIREEVQADSENAVAFLRSWINGGL